jgi:hypothetical protein
VPNRSICPRSPPNRWRHAGDWSLTYTTLLATERLFIIRSELLLHIRFISAPLIVANSSTRGGWPLISALSMASPLAQRSATSRMMVVTLPGSLHPANRRSKMAASPHMRLARVGYLYMLSDMVGIWIKLGISYWSLTQTTYDHTQTSSTSETTETANEAAQHGIFFTPSVSVLLAPVPHFAFLLGLRASFTTDGGHSYKTSGTTVHEGDYSAGLVGISAGLLGYL